MRILSRTVSCLTMVLSAAAIAAAQPVAVARTDIRVYDGPRAIVTGDFDRNGRADIATANLGAASVSVVMNFGDQQYSHSYDHQVGAGPFDLAAADVNGDGAVDLAVANADANSVSILSGTGIGGFRPLTTFSTAASPRGLAAADFDRDGVVDLAVSAWGANAVQLFKGDGAGGFTLLRTTATGMHPQGLATGDINRDGKLDLVVAHNDARTAVLFGDGRGAFTLHELLAGPSTARVVALADFNRDDFLDLAVVSMGGSVAIYTFNLWYYGDQDGRWTFQYVRTMSTAGAGDARGIAAADLNGDGRLDLATANRGGDNVTVYIGQQLDWFRAGVNVASGDGARAIAAADFDRDGRIDLATGNEYGDSVSALHNRTDIGESGFSFTTSRVMSTDAGQFHATSLCIGTFRPGGSRQFAMYARYDDGRISLNTQLAEGGTSGRTIDGPPTPMGCAIADFNRSGWNDYAVISLDNHTLSIYPGGEGIAIGDRAPWITPVGGRPIGFAVGEFNGDGIPDVAITSDGHADNWKGITIFLGKGDFTFTAAGSQPLWDAFPDVTVADFNRDGRADVIASDAYTDAIVFLAGDGAGGLLPGSNLPWGGQPTDLATADFDEDGILDVVVLDDYVHARVMLGNGDGTFQQPTEYPMRNISSGGGDLTVGDMNRDGHADIVTASSILFGAGDGTFANLLELASGFFVPVVADVNQDGLTDLVTTTVFADGVGLVILTNTHNTTNGTPRADAGPDQSTPAGGLVTLDGGNSRDPDSHALQFEWRNEKGELVFEGDRMVLRRSDPGSYRYTLTVRDQFGASSTDSMVLTVRTDSAYRELVLFAGDLTGYVGSWQYVRDETAAGGTRIYHPNAGAPKVTAPVANPAHYVELRFWAEAGYPYHLWIRGKADQNHWANDSLFVQFDNALSAVGGSPAYRIGTTRALAWNLEECSGCGLSGWGWEDTGWGAVNQIGPDVVFASTGWQRMRIQAREDGVSIDQIVLSAGTYFRTRPGTAKNDNTILTRKP